MLSKQEHIQHWVTSAQEDWDTSQLLLTGKRYSFCLFAMHLVIEKLLKAIWVKESLSDNTPPFTLDLIRLVEECGLSLSPDDMDFLTIVNSWNIRGRYPDFTKTLHHIATESYIQRQKIKLEALKSWLEEKI
ncbi:MAG: HEPN domain-containing protein [Saprospiraceae bacterium]|nr:HEPN domain-containing protein [Saprospiraceae bacterium]